MPKKASVRCTNTRFTWRELQIVLAKVPGKCNHVEHVRYRVIIKVNDIIQKGEHALQTMRMTLLLAFTNEEGEALAL